jgi:predicted transcriptional regulator
MEELAELLFALASVDRITLFSAIANERLRLTELATKLRASTQETSKHLSRLQEANLIEKGVDGRFAMTPLGKSMSVLLPAFKFLTGQSEYFLTHDISSLPLEFLERIGELEQSQFRHGIGAILSYTSRVFREAEEYVCLSSDNVMDLKSIGGKAVREDLPVKIIVPAGSIVGPLPPTTEMGARIELVLVEKVNAGLALNEKAAGVAFPELSGKIDFNAGFSSDDPRFHKWCTDIFMFQWNQAKPLQSVPKTFEF